MNKYHIVFYYWAAGESKEIDYLGFFEAKSATEAIELAIKKREPINRYLGNDWFVYDWMRQHITAYVSTHDKITEL